LESKSRGWVFGTICHCLPSTSPVPRPLTHLKHSATHRILYHTCRGTMSQNRQPQTPLEHHGFEAWITLESIRQKQPIYAIKKLQGDRKTIECWIKGVPHEVSDHTEAIATPFVLTHSTRLILAYDSHPSLYRLKDPHFLFTRLFDLLVEC
jgi:hypothetical protein